MLVCKLTSRLNLFQFVNYGSLNAYNTTRDETRSIIITRDETRALISKVFHEGESEKDMICQLCPKPKVIRTHHLAHTSNLLRHVRRHHANELKRVIKERLYKE